MEEIQEPLNQKLTEFFTPTFEGRRFELHTLPLSILKDIGAIQDIIFAIAKYLYKKENGSKKRLPKNFKKNLEIHLSHIGKGCARPQFNFISQDGELFLPSHHLFYEQAYEVFLDEVEAANDNNFNSINRDIYYYFDALGRGLEEGEYIEFPRIKNRDRKPVFYNHEIRKSLVIKADKTYTEDIYLRGRIVELKQLKSVFGIKLEHKKGEIIECSFDSSVRQKVVDAVKNYETCVYKIYGLATLNIENEIEKVVDVNEVELVPEDDVPYQIIKLFSLKKGWFDGEGEEINKVNALKLCRYWDKYYDDLNNSDAPLVYLNPNGVLEFEWTFEGVAVSASVNLDDFICDLLVSRLDNAGIIDIKEINLNGGNGFSELIKVINNYYKGD